ncbi:MAG: sphingosine kinase [Acidobacteria bacterium]|nr:MAG: sphingosine kinase [Acidobacteriota bacterium]
MGTLTTAEPALRSAPVEDRAAQSAEVEIIINAAAGLEDKAALRARLEKIFKARRLQARVCVAQSGAELVKLTRRVAEGPTQIVVAGGGDGTVNAVASVLVGTDKALGILPLGTLNHFAKDLRLPLDLEAAAETIISGHVRTVDVGDVNGRVFLNNSSLGLYPSIVRQRKKQQRQGYNKWLAAVWAALVVFKRYPFMSVRLNVDGQEFKRRTPFVFVSNNVYEMDGFQTGARLRLDAGLLCLHVTHKTGRWRLVALGLRALFGRLREAKDFDSLCAREVFVETRRKRLRVATDGEIDIIETPLHYRVRPCALRVLVPEKAVTSAE